MLRWVSYYHFCLSCANYPVSQACPSYARARLPNLTYRMLSDVRHTISCGRETYHAQDVVSPKPGIRTGRPRAGGAGGGRAARRRCRSRARASAACSRRPRTRSEVGKVAAITAVVVLSEGNVLGIVIALVLVSATLSTSMWSWCRFCETRLREAEWRNYTREKK